MQNAVIEFIRETINIILPTNSGQSKERNGSSRKEEICLHFVELLNKYAGKEHDVSFYARQLCITPQYLTKMTKSILGTSANKIIDGFVTHQAKVLLSKHDMTIQKVAEELNFSDQSSFGKFFRKHTNMSPAKYRNNEGE